MSDPTAICSPEEVLSFWFEELSYEAWFTADAGLDAQCTRRFRDTHLALSRGLDERWRATPEARLAAIILFDQLPRNMYRASPLAFATDSLALREARLALDAGIDADMTVHQRAFLYLPFEHSENLTDQTDSVRLFAALGDPKYLDFAIRHCEIIRKFGRFPHRNAILGRNSTEAEIAFLAQPGSSF
ncbi:hypothetical protein ASE37_13985 [Rhizobium sp. Root268]|nr:hypothetical protein ASC86_13990 [Rhizobium sp. Root1212]KRD24149.1 hypothetical protein ASE37_13985 [Rhizobium sp. Root268]